MPFDQAKNESIRAEIQIAKNQNQLIPFVGAGFSPNILGYKFYRDFINDNIAERLCAIVGVPLANKLNLWDIFRKKSK